jgi:hypothetical protein
MAELDDAVAEACAWLRSLNRNRTGEDVAARLEKASEPVAPEAAAILMRENPGYADTWRKKPEPEPVAPEPEE